MKYDVVTVGAAVRDVFLVSDQFQIIKSKKFAAGLGECMALGSKIEVDELYLSSGGGATNAAATFANFGYKTACMACIGDDANGRDILEELTSFNIDLGQIHTLKESQTGYSVLLTTSTGERTVLVFRGASKRFSQENIDWSVFEKTRWVYLTSLGGDVTLGRRLVETSKKVGAHIVWNPGVPELRENPKAILALLKNGVDVFNVNREEASILTGAPKENILKLFEAMSPENNRIRIITDGENGAYLCNGGSCYHSGTSGKKSKSRTGAGDAFGSGVIASLIRGDGIFTALQVGTLNAESVIQTLGAKQGLLKKFPSGKQLATIPVHTL